MNISSKLFATLVALGVMGSSLIVQAAPPVGKIPLQTYSCKRVNNCYKSLGGVKSGWIAQHNDLIRIYQISDGWVYGDYPAGNTLARRWFKFEDIVMNGNFSNYTARINRSSANVYRTHNSGVKFGTVNNRDAVLVVDKYGSRACIVYNLNAGGYKMGWVDNSMIGKLSNNCFNPVVNNGKKLLTASQVRKFALLAVARQNSRGGLVAAIKSVAKEVQAQGYQSVNLSEYWDTLVKTCVADLTNKAYEKPLNPFNKSYTGHPTNCTWYAWGRMKEVTDCELHLPSGKGNAGLWYENVDETNCRKSKTIGSQCVAEKDGHVVFVEYYDDINEQVYYTECNTGVESLPDFKLQKKSLSKFKSRGFDRYIFSK